MERLRYVACQQSPRLHSSSSYGQSASGGVTGNDVPACIRWLMTHGRSSLLQVGVTGLRSRVCCEGRGCARCESTVCARKWSPTHLQLVIGGSTGPRHTHDCCLKGAQSSTAPLTGFIEQTTDAGSSHCTMHSGCHRIFPRIHDV